MDEVHITIPTSTAHVPPLGVLPVSPPKPKEDPKLNPHQPKIPYPSRLNKTKLLDKNDIPEKLEDPRKFLIPCILQDLEVYNSLADSGASINLMPLSIFEKLGIGPLKPTRMTLELANRSVIFPMGIAEDVIVKVEQFKFLSDFVIVNFKVDPRVAIILGRPFLRTARALVDLYEEKLTLRVGNEEVPISGGTTFPSDSSPSSPLVETSDSHLEEFADELALLDPFPQGNKDDNFDPEADLREIEYLMNQDSFTVSSPTTNIDISDPILDRFTDKPTLVYSSPLGDDDDDLFDFSSDNDEWKKLLYGDSYNDTYSKNDKTKDSKTKSLIDEANIVESTILPPYSLTSDSTLPEELSESSEIATLLSFPFGNEDKVFNPGILILGETQIFNNKSKDKELKVNTSSEAFLILEERNFLSISSDRELLFFLELTVIETLLSFSSENDDKVFNPGILTSKGVHSFILGLSHRTYETFKIINVHPNILNEGPMKIFFCSSISAPRTKEFGESQA
ncbi:reverse transcriptase domain-containing protein [Tanacetum coccineum]